MTTLKILIWTPRGLDTIAKDNNFTIILPMGREAIPAGEILSICVLHKGIYKEIVKAKVVGLRTAPLGRVMETEWAMHIGPRESESYLQLVGEKYKREINVYNCVSVITLRPTRIFDEILLPLRRNV